MMSRMSSPSGQLDLWSGVGLVAANMIGVGVFISAGFMANDLSPTWILLTWVAGLVLAMAAALAYAPIARAIPRSGGEYRFLSELMHPALGYVAGWGSMLAGFSAPVAADAVFAAEYLGKITAVGNVKLVATIVIAVVTVFHLFDLKTSKWAQNILVIGKIGLLVGFVGIGLFGGSYAFPEWTPIKGDDSFQLTPIMANLVWVMFAFSGWNAVAYAAGDFRNPVRDVWRAMIYGCLIVGALYLVINWIFVANLDAREAFGASVGFDSERNTLGHAVMEKIVGTHGARLMAIFFVIAFVSAISAMTLVGPRVYAAMARDGYLPQIFAGRDGKPPAGSILLQGGIATALIYIQSLEKMVKNVAALLIIFSALTAAGVYRLLLSNKLRERFGIVPPIISVAGATLYIVFSAWMIYAQLKDQRSLLWWIGAVVAAALIGYFATVALRPRRQP